MKYYSQFGEDAALYPIFKDVKNGYYVDVGAHDGVTDSNTLFYAKNNDWKGICVEPHSVYYSKLVKNRPKATCLNHVVWSSSYDVVSFHETAPGGWSRVDGGGKYPTVNVSHPVTRTLDDILCEYLPCFTDINIMSIDVEGHEHHVLEGFTLDDYRPRIIILEDLSHKGNHDAYFKDYKPVYAWKQGKPGSNIIYCREEEDYNIVKQRYRG